MQTAFSDSTHSRDQLEGAFQLFNQMSAQLIEAYQELQSRVLTLSQELAAVRNERMQLQQRVERQNRLSAMGEMAAQLAHQIRTPLSSALIDNSHLAKPDLSQVQRKRFSDRCQRRLKHIERQIGDMLSFARGGQYEPAPVPITPLLEELVQTLRPMLIERGACLTLNDQTDSRCRVSGNRDALLGAFVNLASNALDHGDEPVHIRLTLKQQEAVLQISFCDNGPGIANDISARIFDPFFTTRSDGTGLGLAVVQSVILGHMGTISLRQPAVDGACFHIALPLLPE